MIKQIKKRKLEDIRLQLMIIQNPHTKNPQQLWKSLDEQDKVENKTDKFDPVGFDRLKGALAKDTKMVVK